MKKLKFSLFCLVCANAFAEISLYGRIAVGMEDDHFPGSTVQQTGSIQDYGSYFGIRGNENLYGNTQFIFQIEQLLDITAGQSYYLTTASGSIVNSNLKVNGRVMNEFNTFATSDSYMGMRGDWGQVKAGNLSNYMRSDMGSVDLYNYANGGNGLSVWSRTASVQILPRTINYRLPDFAGFDFTAFYSFNNSGSLGVSPASGGNTTVFGNGNSGFTGSVYGFGLGWGSGNFSVKLGSQIWQNVGTSVNGTSSETLPANLTSAAQYNNAYVDRLELAYNDDDGIILGLGMQVTNGLGWQAWANSGGSFNNYVVNPGYNYAGLSTNQFQTQEFGASIGYHLGAWTPKVGYAYGNNLMYNGNLASVAAGTANQIPNSGYQQFVVELDWNITPRTIVFVNYGQLWYGNTLQNISYCGLNANGSNGCNNGNPVGSVNSSNASYFNQGTGALGFSHTF